MKILIFGAAGSGTTTLGKELGEKLNWLHLDSDDYYWKKTNPPFQAKIPLEQRNAAITQDFESASDAIVSGSMITWGKRWENAFDLAVFLYIPKEIRMDRLKKREVERYGDLLKTDTKTISTSKIFLKWAENYDDLGFDGRNIIQHKTWMELFTCPVLQIVGDTTVEERINKIANYL